MRIAAHFQVAVHHFIPVEVGQCVAQLIRDVLDVDRLEDVGS